MSEVTDSVSVWNGSLLSSLPTAETGRGGVGREGPENMTPI